MLFLLKLCADPLQNNVFVTNPAQPSSPRHDGQAGEDNTATIDINGPPSTPLSAGPIQIDATNMYIQIGDNNNQGSVPAAGITCTTPLPSDDTSEEVEPVLEVEFEVEENECRLSAAEDSHGNFVDREEETKRDELTIPAMENESCSSMLPSEMNANSTADNKPNNGDEINEQDCLNNVKQQDTEIIPTKAPQSTRQDQQLSSDEGAQKALGIYVRDGTCSAEVVEEEEMELKQFLLEPQGRNDLPEGPSHPGNAEPDPQGGNDLNKDMEPKLYWPERQGDNDSPGDHGSSDGLRGSSGLPDDHCSLDNTDRRPQDNIVLSDDLNYVDNAGHRNIHSDNLRATSDDIENDIEKRNRKTETLLCNNGHDSAEYTDADVTVYRSTKEMDTNVGSTSSTWHLLPVGCILFSSLIVGIFVMRKMKKWGSN